MVLAAVLGITACTNLNNEQEEDATHKVYVPADAVILPGLAIGQIALGQDIKEIVKLLGKADTEKIIDGKSWAIWFNPDTINAKQDELALFSVVQNNNNQKIAQIRITSPVFKTKDGIAVGRKLNDIELVFKDLVKLSAYADTVDEKDNVLLYDSKASGIAFEIKDGWVKAITLHHKNNSVNDSYLTSKTNWHKIE